MAGISDQLTTPDTPAPAESAGHRKPANFAKGHPLVIFGLALRLTLLPGHGIKSGRFLFNVLAAAFGTFRVYLVFLQGEN
jgi:hypothetical protein